MMSANGLTKLVEECGELVQICAKKMAYYNSDEHIIELENKQE